MGGSATADGLAVGPAHGLGAATARVEEARALVAGTGPREWRAAAARAFEERLAEHARACERALDALAGAAECVRAHEAELAGARAALSPFSGSPRPGPTAASWSGGPG